MKRPLRPRDLHVLLSLAEQPSYGFPIIAAIEERTGGALRLDPANLYRALYAMAEAGWVEDWDPAGEGDERRRHYRLTPAGRAVLSQELGLMQRALNSAAARSVLK